ncbi:hypothetical protein DITRI_Ditri15bG0038800 [Diplodiscus trichospermus]
MEHKATAYIYILWLLLVLKILELETSSLFIDVEEECIEDEDCDEDYTSILKPAFMVEGEPDFDSGPPEDGLEYLRRVSARISCELMKVTVQKEDLCQLPESVVVAKCDNLATNDQTSCNATDSSILLSYYNPGSDQTSMSNAADGLILLSHHNPGAKTSINDTHGDYPTLSAIQKMDSVARVSLLRKRISSVENMSSLSRSNCVWLFALCAAVDMPLDADTYAYLRSLLRK